MTGRLPTITCSTWSMRFAAAAVPLARVSWRTGSGLGACGDHRHLGPALYATLLNRAARPDASATPMTKDAICVLWKSGSVITRSTQNSSRIVSTGAPSAASRTAVGRSGWAVMARPSQVPSPADAGTTTQAAPAPSRRGWGFDHEDPRRHRSRNHQPADRRDDDPPTHAPSVR